MIWDLFSGSSGKNKKKKKNKNISDQRITVKKDKETIKKIVLPKEKIKFKKVEKVKKNEARTKEKSLIKESKQDSKNLEIKEKYKKIHAIIVENFKNEFVADVLGRTDKNSIIEKENIIYKNALSLNLIFGYLKTQYKSDIFNADLGKYFFIKLKDDLNVLIMNLKEYQYIVILKADMVNLGLFENVILPDILKEF